jgi:solute carrier family 25 (mitochondrial iron transporter), member 28/37
VGHFSQRERKNWLIDSISNRRIFFFFFVFSWNLFGGMEFVEDILKADDDDGGDKDEFGGNVWKHMMAGAVAGVAEHCGMFPLDTIKTHMMAYRPIVIQSPSTLTSSAATGVAVQHTVTATEAAALLASRTHESMRAVGTKIVHEHGMRGLFRGIKAMALGAAPAHAIYFATYEAGKDVFGAHRTDGHHPVATAAAGIMATVCSDAVLTPMDAVKQKMQLQRREYVSVRACIRHTLASEGLLRGFYGGYTTTLTMNVPYVSVYFASYESLKKTMAQSPYFDPHSHSLHLIAGAGAGTLAAAFTNPLDVAKTRLQTQGDAGRMYNGMVDALHTLRVEEGWGAFTKGIRPRMLFHSLSGAICWSTYEYMKMLLS